MICSQWHSTSNLRGLFAVSFLLIRSAEELPQMLGTSLESNMFSVEPPRVYNLPNKKLMAGLPPGVGPNPYINYITYHIDNYYYNYYYYYFVFIIIIIIIIIIIYIQYIYMLYIYVIYIYIYIYLCVCRISIPIKWWILLFIIPTFGMILVISQWIPFFVSYSPGCSQHPIFQRGKMGQIGNFRPC